MTRLAIGTPVYDGGAKVEFFRSMFALATQSSQLGLTLTPLVIKNESTVQKARNVIATEFLKTDNEFLMFIDADIGFVPGYIRDLVDANKDIIGGIYPLKSLNIGSLVRASLEGRDPMHDAGNFVVNLIPGVPLPTRVEPFPVARLGTGFLMIRRNVLETLSTAVNYYWDTNPFSGAREKILELFPVHVVNHELLTEDYAFCELARHHGFSVHANPSFVLSHAGSFEFHSCFLCSKGVKLHTTHGKDAKCSGHH